MTRIQIARVMQKGEPVLRFGGLFQRKGELGDEICPALALLTFGNVRTNAGPASLQLLRKNEFMLRIPKILAELYDPYGETIGLISDHPNTTIAEEYANEK